MRTRRPLSLALLAPALAASLAAAGPADAPGGPIATMTDAASRCLPPARRTLSPCFRAPAGPISVAFLDADSTLRVSKSGNVSANHPTDVLLLPRVAPTLARLVRKGQLVVIVSNQGGIEHGYVSREDADAALRHTIELLATEGATVHYYDFAEGSDEYRKPGTGMAREAARVIRQATGREVDWTRSYMVGDSGWKRGHDEEPFGRPGEDFSNSDRRFAEAVRREMGVPLGFRFYHPRDFFGWARQGIRNFRSHEDLERYRAVQER